MKLFKKKEVPTPFSIEVTQESLLDKSLLHTEKLDFQKYPAQDVYYYLFENVFYNQEIITKIQANYVEYVPQSDKYFLDIGCGRGEFLNLLPQSGIKAKGIEINILEADLLTEKGFDVVNQDAVSYLEQTEEIFSGISAIQVVEHLEFDYLYKFIHLAYRQIMQGGVIILETLNPLLTKNLKYFYTDLTHKRPIPPDSLVFLCEFAGFKDVKIRYSLPEDDEYVNYAVIGYKK